MKETAGTTKVSTLRLLVLCNHWASGNFEECREVLRVRHDWAISLSRIGEGNGNPLQYSCLENPRDGGAWWAAVYGVAQSRTRLKRRSSSSSSREVLAAFSFILGLKAQSDQLWGSWFSRLPHRVLREWRQMSAWELSWASLGWLPYRTCVEGEGVSAPVCTSLDDCLPFQSIRIYTPPKIVVASKCWAFAVSQVLF